MPKMSFVEVSDTRVSRLHCVIKLAAPTDSSTAPQAVLEDHSSNGTYVDDVRVKQGEPMVLTSGSKVSLVRSVTPWVERCFTFWEGTQLASCCFAHVVFEPDCTYSSCAACPFSRGTVIDTVEMLQDSADMIALISLLPEHCS